MTDYLGQIRFFCQKYKIKPKREEGQNFLIKEKIFQKIIAEVDLKNDDLILEVGAGTGFLTTEILKKAKKVLAVELDQRLFAILKRLLALNKNLKLIKKDILKISNEEIVRILGAKEMGGGIYDYKIVANLPFNISSFFLRKFLSYPVKPKLLILLLQKELAERIVVRAGEMSLLSLSCQFYAEPEIITIVPKDSFWPRPGVDSALIRIKTIEQQKKYRLLDDFNEKRFWQIIKISFSARRKMLKNNLVNGLKISPEETLCLFRKLGFKETIRAQELTIIDWLKIDELLRTKDLFDYLNI